MDAFWKIWSEFLQLLYQVGDFIILVLRVTFGKIYELYLLPVSSLPLLEQLIYLVVLTLLGISTVLVLWQQWKKIKVAFGAIIDLIVSVIRETPHFVVLLAAAIMAAWVITSFDIDPGWPNLQTLWKRFWG